jgi:ribose transport system substrate-binding protein
MVTTLGGRRLGATAAVLAGIVATSVFAGCGSSSSDTSTSSTGSSTASSSGDLIQDKRLPAAPSNTSGADIAAAQKELLKLFEPVKFQPAGPAFDITQVQKPVWLISATAKLPPDEIVTNAFVEAAKAAGVPFHSCPGESTPEGNALCLRQAIQAKAGSVIIWSQNVDTLAQPLKEARAAGIKIIDGNNAERIGEQPPASVDAAVSFNFYAAGQANGAYAVAAKGADLNALCLDIPEFLVTKAACDGFTDSVHQYCPECKVETKDVPLAQLETQTGALVNQAALQNSQLNFVMDSLDSFNSLVLAALRRANKTPDQVMVGGVLGTPEALTAVSKGDYQRVTVGQNPFWWGWAYLDAGARAQAGAIEGTQATQPTKILTTETWDYDGTISYPQSNAIYGYGDGAIYRDGFSSLWKKG